MTTPSLDPCEIEVRALRTHDDYAACVQLQYATWGGGYSDVVPATVLQVAQHVGGVAAGAFAPDGMLLGFVFGLTGVRAGRLVHWSDMLAVRRAHRNLGIGRLLKEFQREAVRALGVELMYWTFDPLVARNAHLNLNRLGATVTEYVVDMYGAGTGSDLHAFGTDRFIVSWPVSGGEAAARAELAASPRAEPAAGIEDVAVQQVEIPPDITALPVSEARAWRARTRPLFQSLLGRGYRVVSFHTEPTRSFYLFERC